MSTFDFYMLAIGSVMIAMIPLVGYMFYLFLEFRKLLAPHGEELARLGLLKDELLSLATPFSPRILQNKTYRQLNDPRLTSIGDRFNLVSRIASFVAVPLVLISSLAFLIPR